MPKTETKTARHFQLKTKTKLSCWSNNTWHNY